MQQPIGPQSSRVDPNIKMSFDENLCFIKRSRKTPNIYHKKGNFSKLDEEYGKWECYGTSEATFRRGWNLREGDLSPDYTISAGELAKELAEGS